MAADPGLLWRRDIDEKGKPQAKEPFQFVAACLEYIAADTHGSEYVSRLPVWLDATSNGLQHLAIMRRDTKLAAMVNLKVTEHDLGIQDVYDIVAKHARQTLYADDDPSSRIWAQRNDLRDLLKQPIMTLPYGLTQSGMLDQIKEACKERGIAASSDAMDRFRDHIWNAIEEKLPGAMETRKYIQNIAQYFLDRGTFMRWTTPSGFAVTNRYCESETRRVRLPFAGQVVKIADGYTDEPQKQKTINSAVANFTHSLDAAHLAMSVNKAVESGITNIMTVHDCFGTLAPDVHLFALIRRWELQELALWNPLLVLREANLPANENDLQLPIFDRDFEPGWLVRSEYFDR